MVAGQLADLVVVLRAEQASRRAGLKVSSLRGPSSPEGGGFAARSIRSKIAHDLEPRYGIEP